jgi:methyl-accepting chemotaxis protein
MPQVQAAEPSASNRRSVRNVLINRALQREFTVAMIAIMMSAGSIVGVMIHFTLAGITEGSPSTISRLALERMLLDVNSQLILGTILVIFITVILTGLFGIFFLHRVAGPVYRFRQVLKQIAAGQMPRQVKLRDKDFFKETAAELNHVIDVLKRHDEASKRIEALLSDQELSQVPPQAAKKLKEIEKNLSDLKPISS